MNERKMNERKILKQLNELRAMVADGVKPEQERKRQNEGNSANINTELRYDNTKSLPYNWDKHSWQAMNLCKLSLGGKAWMQMDSETDSIYMAGEVYYIALDATSDELGDHFFEVSIHVVDLLSSPKAEDWAIMQTTLNNFNRRHNNDTRVM